MSSERITPSHESVEKISNELESARTEKLAQLQEASKESLEKNPEAHAENRAEEARDTIDRQDAQPEPGNQSEAEAKPVSPPTRIWNQHLNYSQTLVSLQRKLNPVSKTFSKVIHAPIVEKASEALESNVARPSVMLGTTWTALIVGTIFYLTARRYGYTLSGSELLFSFIVGALLGLVLEGIWLTLKRR